MDATGKIYLAIAVISVIAAIVAFWFISRKTPKGTLLAVGIILWIVGQSIASQPVREMRLISGVCKFSGFIGGILGLFDVFRRRKDKESPNKSIQNDREKAAPPPFPGP
jgi:hypothetical protein